MAQNKIPQAEFDAKIAVVTEIDWARLAAFVDGEGSAICDSGFDTVETVRCR